MNKLFASLMLVVLLPGCMLMPLKPGNSSFKSPAGAQATVQQSENPQQETTQVYTISTDDKGVVTERFETKIGAAQKDLAREMAAKLGSLKGVVWVGVLVFLFGAVSFFYPPLKLLIGSTTTSAVIAAAGLALIILPTLIVGNEILILCIALGAAGLYWFSHRHGHIRGRLTELEKE